MILVTCNKSRQLIYISYSGRVTQVDFEAQRDDLITQLAEMSPGFKLLADFTQFGSMELECAVEIGRMMKLIGQAKVGLVVRVIPDPSKDIGLNILTAFHYSHRPRTVTCLNFAEAARALDL